jgi:hypothetical protein
MNEKAAKEPEHFGGRRADLGSPVVKLTSEEESCAMVRTTSIAGAISVQAAKESLSYSTKVVPTTGLEPINKVFSPLPTLASFSVFIAHTVTSTFNFCKHYLCLFGK